MGANFRAVGSRRATTCAAGSRLCRHVHRNTDTSSQWQIATVGWTLSRPPRCAAVPSALWRQHLCLPRRTDQIDLTEFIGGRAILGVERRQLQRHDRSSRQLGAKSSLSVEYRHSQLQLSHPRSATISSSPE